MKSRPVWVDSTFEVISEYRLKPKPKMPQGYISYLQKSVKVPDSDAKHYMNTMMGLEAERVGWLQHMEDVLPFTDDSERKIVYSKIKELKSGCFWEIGKGSKMTKAEEHFAYMGQTKEEARLKNWKD